MRVLIDGQTLATPDVGRGIGRVFLGVTTGMLQRDVGTDWVVAVPRGADPAALPAWARERARLVEIAPPDLSQGYGRATEAWTDALSSLCDRERIDAYWCPNPMMLNVVLPLGLEGPRRVCTMYDVIPARLPETHQAAWSDEQRSEYHRRLSGIGAWADRLIFISEAARADYLDLVGRETGETIAVPLGVDHTIFWSSAALSRPPPPGYVLAVAGADPRKNTERVIEAFARTVSDEEAFEGLPLWIAGGHDPLAEERLRAHAERCGVAERLVLLGRVSDRSLSRTYREASVLLFPSLYEGFGLPVLEAMACGLPVIASDRPELRECGGDHARYCDPSDVSDIAAALARVLRDPAAARADGAEAVAHARRFTWERTADRYLEAMTLPIRARSERRRTRRPRIAWATPWPPARSGIAAYSREVVERLLAHADVVVFSPTADPDPAPDDAPVLPLGALAERRREFDQVVYHLGNSVAHHHALYRAAWDEPGVIVLHDWNLHAFLHDAYCGSQDDELYRLALDESHGRAGRREYERVAIGGADPEVFEYPASQAIAARSRATIVHSDWIRRRLPDVPGVHVVPHGAWPRAQAERSPRREAAARAGIGADRFVVGAFGFINAHKRVPSLVEACARLVADGHALDLLLVGDVNDDQLDLHSVLEEHGARSFTHLTGFVDEEEYWDHLDACDVVVNLRYPTMGESSGSLMRALGSGKACITSDYGPVAELPDTVCWKVTPDHAEVDELEALIGELLRRPGLRRQLGDAAHEWVASVVSYERIAALYASVLGRLAPERAPERLARTSHAALEVEPSP